MFVEKPERERGDGERSAERVGRDWDEGQGGDVFCHVRFAVIPT